MCARCHLLRRAPPSQLRKQVNKSRLDLPLTADPRTTGEQEELWALDEAYWKGGSSEEEDGRAQDAMVIDTMEELEVRWPRRLRWTLADG